MLNGLASVAVDCGLLGFPPTVLVSLVHCVTGLEIDQMLSQRLPSVQCIAVIRHIDDAFPPQHAPC